MDEPDYYELEDIPGGPTGWDEAAFQEEMSRKNAHMVFQTLMQAMPGMRRQWIWRGAREFKHDREMMDLCMGRPRRDLWKNVLVAWLRAARQQLVNVRGWILFWWFRYCQSGHDGRTRRGRIRHANYYHLLRLRQSRRTDVQRSARICAARTLVNYK